MLRLCLLDSVVLFATVVHMSANSTPETPEHAALRWKWNIALVCVIGLTVLLFLVGDATNSLLLVGLSGLLFYGLLFGAVLSLIPVAIRWVSRTWAEGQNR